MPGLPEGRGRYEKHQNISIICTPNNNNHTMCRRPFMAAIAITGNV